MEAYVRHRRRQRFKDMTMDISLVVISAVLWAMFFGAIGFMLSGWF